MDNVHFEWNASRDEANQRKHGVGFFEAIEAFADPFALHAVDDAHSAAEPRWFCVGRTRRGIVTVRYTRRRGVVRIIGAGYWRKGRKLYENEKTDLP
jgi:uncharacterized DUF497 family protein